MEYFDIYNIKRIKIGFIEGREMAVQKRVKFFREKYGV